MGSDDLDETLDETFPASDAPANTVETRIGPPRSPDSGPIDAPGAGASEPRTAALDLKARHVEDPPIE
jgi:hypothetical protein